jgi:hypothetical protein
MRKRFVTVAAAGVIEEAEGLGGSARLTHPIRCRVSGGYTISKLQGFRGADSPESLLTCILQVKAIARHKQTCTFICTTVVLLYHSPVISWPCEFQWSIPNSQDDA